MSYYDPNWFITWTGKHVMVKSSTGSMRGTWTLPEEVVSAQRSGDGFIVVCQKHTYIYKAQFPKDCQHFTCISCLPNK